jgi:hypothetical protein
VRHKVLIVVDGFCLEVHKNLHAALLRLRLKDAARRLWADAICINQKDDAEKSEQVQMMREIYQQGSRTLVWLGQLSSMRSRRSFRLIPRLLKAHEALQLGNEVAASSPPVLTDFLSIFELPYFTRIWVIQEVAVSSSVEVICGENSISWDDLDTAVNMAEQFGAEPYFYMRRLELFLKISNARFAFQAGIKPNLLRILVQYRGTSATCEKDKIYALLGLTDLEDEHSVRIVPDYREEYSIEDAYQHAAVSILTTTGNLDLLSVPGPSLSNP